MATRPSGRAALLASLALGACASEPQLTMDTRLRLAAAAGGGTSLSAARAAAHQRPDDAVALSRWAATAEAAGARAEAAQAMQAVIAREGPSEPRFVALGQLLLRAGDAPGASQAFSQALAMNPSSTGAAGGLGLAHDLAGDRAAAQASYRRGLSVAPRDWVLRSNLAVSLVASGAAGDAVGVLAEAETGAAVPAHARHNLALALAADGQTERAVRLLRTEMGPDEARTMVQDFTAFARWFAGRQGEPAGRLALSVATPMAMTGALRDPVAPSRAPDPPAMMEPSPPVIQASAPPPAARDIEPILPARTGTGATDREAPVVEPSFASRARGGGAPLRGPAADFSTTIAAGAENPLTLGEAAIAAGDVARAEAILRDAREGGRDPLEIALLDARVARALGETARARRALEEASRLRERQLQGG